MKVQVPAGTRADVAPTYEPFWFPLKAQLNPLRSLTMQRVVLLLEQAEYGRYSDVTWLYKFVEKREPVMRALKERRLSALEKKQWRIVLTDEASESPVLKAAAEEQRDWLKKVFGAIDNLPEAWTWLGTSTFRGFAHLEKHYSRDWTVVHLEPVPQWFFARQYPRKQWLYDRTASSLTGEAISYVGPNADWIVRECDAPLGEIGAISYVWKVNNLKDWGAFCSVFGIPNVFAKAPTGTDAPTPEQFAAMQSKVDLFVSNGRGTLPPGWDVEIGAGVGGDDQPFKTHVEYLDTMMVLAGTGGKLTMLASPTGIGEGATGAHEAVFDDIAEAEAASIAAILHKSIAAPELDYRFPGQPHLVRFEIGSKMRSDPNEAADLMAKLKLGGYMVEEAEAEKMVGVKLERMPVEQQVLSSSDGGFAMNRTQEEDAVRDAVATVEAVARDRLKGVVEAVAKAIDLPNGERDAALGRIGDELPRVLEELNKDEAGADAIEEAIAKAFAAGLQET